MACVLLCFSVKLELDPIENFKNLRSGSPRSPPEELEDLTKDSGPVSGRTSSRNSRRESPYYINEILRKPSFGLESGCDWKREETI